VLSLNALQSRVALLSVLVCAAVPAPTSAQLCPPREGVPLPPYVDELRQIDPTAYRMEHAWIARSQAVAAAQQRAGKLLNPGAETSVSGVLRAPIFLLLFADSPGAVYPADRMRRMLFGEERSVRDFYREMSHGLLSVEGEVYDWFELNELDTYYEGMSSGTRPGDARTGEIIYECLSAQDAAVDFAQFDNDGPDGLPNSGDDDGYVDFVAFVHPESGGECGGSGNLWSHRWRYSAWPKSQGIPFVTDDAAAGGGSILIDDYTLQPALGCDPSTAVEMGIFCHEFGHVFGLPDLYDLDGGGQGLGHWGLMASGNWNQPASPAHMSAWSKQQLGWVTTQVVDWEAMDVWIDAVQTDPTVYEIPFHDERWRRQTGSALDGNASLAVGLDAAEAAVRGWKAAGYGNGWHETIAHDFESDGSSAPKLSFDYRIDSEAAFDFGFVLLETGGKETTLIALDGKKSGRLEFDLGASAREFKIKFRFRSDHYYSTEDGRHVPYGPPFAIDDIELVGGGIDYAADFEEHVGGWYAPQTERDNPVHERWLIECRSAMGYDRNLPGEGLLIYHVDDQVLATAMGNRGTDGRTRGLVLEEADGRGHLSLPNAGRGDAGDVWPGNSNSMVFDASSLPSSLSNSGRQSGCSVRILDRVGSAVRCELTGGRPAPRLSAVISSGDSPDLLWLELVGAANISHGARFRLVGRGVPSRESTELKWEDHDRVGARFALRGLPAGEYDLVVENPDGQTAILGAAVRVDGSKNAPLPTRLALEQNFPNPFNPRTTIRFELPLPSPVRLSIFDARGRQVRTLVDEVLPPGSYDEFWNGEDDARRAVASGVYFYELRAGTARELRKMLLLR